MKGTLFYFTESFPYGLGESWKTNELNVLRKYFRDIYVMPLWKAGNDHPVEVEGNNVHVMEPALDSLTVKSSLSDLLFLLRPAVWKELRTGKTITDRNKIRKCIGFIKNAERLKASEAFRFVQQHSNEDTIWYFFWGRGWADLLPFIPKPAIRKIAVKLHGYDLYLERNNGYIPFRQQMLNSADVLVPISENGRNYLISKYGLSQNKVILSRLGTLGVGLSESGTENELNILSCFGIVPVKRMDRIINGLKLISDIRINWVHIGNGPMMEEMEQAADTLPSNITIHFAGKKKPAEVLQHYLDHPTDLIINTSESEGVPVSIMEAFSAGVPAIATAVGGTAEIVDNSVGKLLSASPDPEEIAAAIRQYHQLPREEKLAYRQRAFERFRERCDAAYWAEHLNQILQ